MSRVLFLLLVVCTFLSSCAVTNRLFRNTGAGERAAKLLQLQLNVMRFADEYTARITDQIVAFQQGTENPNERLVAQ